MPSAGLLRVRAEGGGFEWRDVGARYEAAIEQASAGLAPRPAARLRGLSAEPVEAKVDAVVPPPSRAPADGGSGGGTPWWIALVLAAGGVIAVLGRRRGRGVPATG